MTSEAHSDLKTCTEPFEAVCLGGEAEVVIVDTNLVQVGDVLRLREYDRTRKVYSGRAILAHVTGVVTEAAGLPSGFCILRIQSAEEGVAYRNGARAPLDTSLGAILARVREPLHTQACLEYAARMGRAFCIISCADARRERESVASSAREPAVRKTGRDPAVRKSVDFRIAVIKSPPKQPPAKRDKPEPRRHRAASAPIGDASSPYPGQAKSARERSKS